MYGKGPHAQVTCWKNRRVSWQLGQKRTSFGTRWVSLATGAKTKTFKPVACPSFLFPEAHLKRATYGSASPMQTKIQRPLRGAANVAFIGLSMACTGTFPSERVFQTSCFSDQEQKRTFFGRWKILKEKQKKSEPSKKRENQAPQGQKGTLFGGCVRQVPLQKKKRAQCNKEHPTKTLPAKKTTTTQALCLVFVSPLQKKEQDKKQANKHCPTNPMHSS